MSEGLKELLETINKRLERLEDQVIENTSDIDRLKEDVMEINTWKN